MKLKGVRSVFGLSLLLVAGCSKTAGFVHQILPPPPTQEQRFVFPITELKKESGKIDILWVIDNSGSMDDKQQIVIDNTADFMKEFTTATRADWKMGLISTDQKDQPYIGFEKNDLLDSKSVDPVAKFQQAVRRLGTFGDGYEKFFTPVMNALTEFPEFIRPDAYLALIAVSDAKEQSPVGPTEFLDFMKARKPLNRMLGYAALAPVDWGCVSSGGEDSWLWPGSAYEGFFGAIAGKTYPLCQSGFGKYLAEVGKDIVKRIPVPKVPLKTRPKVGTIQVFHEGKLLPGGPKESGGFWLYDFEKNAILFHDLEFAPQETESVTVVYEEDTKDA